MTVEAFEQWLRAQDKSEHTIHAYTGALERFALWFRQTNGKALTPVELTPLDVKAYRQHLSVGRKLAPSTVNQALAALRTYSRWARTTGEIAHNPTTGIQMVQETPAPPRWLERTEQFALLRAARETMQLGYLQARGQLHRPSVIWSRRDEGLLILMLNTGLRLSEMAGVDLTDIDINARSGGVDVRQGKGRKKRRVPLNIDARTALQAWLEVRPENQSLALFLSQKGGTRMSARAISRVIKKLAQKADVKHVTPHTLRHSFAKNLVDAGVSLEKVATLLGHESLETTRIYTQPSQADLQVATEKIAWQE